MSESEKDIAAKLNREADQDEASSQDAEAQQGELITKRAESADQERYKKALEQGRVITGWIIGGIGFVWPYVQIDDKELAETSAQRHADVLLKYNLENAGEGAMPEWLAEWMPEIRLAMMYGLTGFSIWMQIQAHKAAQAAQAETETQPGAEDGDTSKPCAT